MKTRDLSPSNAHDVERIEELEKELKELKDRIVEVGANYIIDERMYRTFGGDMDKEIRAMNMERLVHQIYQSDLFTEKIEDKMTASESGAYRVKKFTHKIYVVLPKRDLK